MQDTNAAKLGQKSFLAGTIVTITSEKNGKKGTKSFDSEAVWAALSAGSILDRAAILTGAAQSALHRPGGGGGIDPFLAAETPEDWAAYLAARGELTVPAASVKWGKLLPERPEIVERLKAAKAAGKDTILVFGEEIPIATVLDADAAAKWHHAWTLRQAKPL